MRADERAAVPDACILPTAEQPLRLREFEQLFAADVLGVMQEAPDLLRLDLRPDPAVAARTADLAARETGCCSFFTFELTVGADRLSLAVRTAPGHEEVLAALARLARS